MKRRRVRLLLAWLAGPVTAAACHHGPPPRAPVVFERRACLANPPPASVEVAPTGPAQGCSSDACLTRDQLLALVRYLRALQTYSRDAYTACGPTPPATPSPGGTP